METLFNQQFERVVQQAAIPDMYELSYIKYQLTTAMYEIEDGLIIDARDTLLSVKRQLKVELIHDVTAIPLLVDVLFLDIAKLNIALKKVSAALRLIT